MTRLAPNVPKRATNVPEKSKQDKQTLKYILGRLCQSFAVEGVAAGHVQYLLNIRLPLHLGLPE